MKWHEVSSRRQAETQLRPYHHLLATLGQRGTLLVCPKGDAIYAQGDAADAIFFVQNGRVRLTVVSHAGKERTIGLVSEGSFFGEGSLAGQARRTGSAAAMTNCELLRVDKALMLEALQRERPLADLFLASPVGPQHPVRRRPRRSAVQLE